MVKAPLRGRPKGAIPANEHQSLSQRLRWLRQHQNPYMTQEQLADLSGVSLSFIRSYETGGQRHMSTETIQKLAAALRCRFTIRLKRLSDREIAECQVEGPPLPFAPKRSRKISAEARARALSRECSPWTAYHQRKRQRSHKLTSGIEGSPSAQEIG